MPRRIVVVSNAVPVFTMATTSLTRWLSIHAEAAGRLLEITRNSKSKEVRLAEVCQAKASTFRLIFTVSTTNVFQESSFLNIVMFRLESV